MTRLITRFTVDAGMSSAKWMQLPVYWLPVCALTPTQDICDLTQWRDSPCPDPFIHVVRLGSVLYIEDGHHRHARARRDHQWTIGARVLTVNPAAPEISVTV